MAAGGTARPVLPHPVLRLQVAVTEGVGATWPPVLTCARGSREPGAWASVSGPPLLPA